MEALLDAYKDQFGAGYGIPGLVLKVAHVGWGKKPFLWMLLEPVALRLSDGTELFIPAGYTTNFASVPRLLWSLLSPIGWHNVAALAHDYLYDYRWRRDEIGDKQARKFADHEYRHFLRLAEPRSWIKRDLHYWAVRLGGKRYWKD